jgi:YcaO-like protein with predicted kinase domain
MILHDSLKGFEDGAVAKVIPSAETVQRVLARLETMEPPVMASYTEFDRPSHIPQFRVLGTERFRRLVGLAGQNGKGHNRDQALASGLMELVERYSCFGHILWRVSRTATFADLRTNPFRLSHLFGNFLPGRAVQVLSDREATATRLRWYAGWTLMGKPALLPLGLICNLLEGSNGMAAGNTLEEALLHALCELVERHCTTMIAYERRPTPQIDPATITSPIALDLLQRFTALGHKVLIKDFSLGLGLPVIGVVRLRGEGRVTLTAGVATLRDEALIRALTESSQAEMGEETERTEAGCAHHLAPTETVRFADVPEIANENMRVEIERLEAIFARQGWQAFLVDATDPELQIPCVCTFIAGARYDDERIANRNLLYSLLEESLAIGDARAVVHLLDLGERQDILNQPVYWQRRAALLQRQGGYRAARAYFARAAAADKGALPAAERKQIQRSSLVSLALCSLALGERAAAIDAFRQVVDVDPAHDLSQLLPLPEEEAHMPHQQAQVLHDAARLGQEVKRARLAGPRLDSAAFKGAFDRYERARDYAGAKIKQATYLYQIQQYAGALEATQAALSTDAEAAGLQGAHLLAGLSLEQLGRYVEAIAAFRQAQEMIAGLDEVDEHIAHCGAMIKEPSGD